MEQGHPEQWQEWIWYLAPEVELVIGLLVCRFPADEPLAHAAKGLQTLDTKVMILGGFFFFVNSMKEIIHPVPASWMEASSVQILLNLKCLQSSVQKINRFKSAADAPRTPRMAFTQDFPLKIPVNRYYITLIMCITYQSVPRMLQPRTLQALNSSSALQCSQ